MIVDVWIFGVAKCLELTRGFSDEARLEFNGNEERRGEGKEGGGCYYISQ